jgi:hypothetical protein
MLLYNYIQNVIKRMYGMKTIIGSRRSHYLARVGCLFAVIALIVAIGGCGEGEGEGGDDYYWLYITSTYGGSVITPEEGDLWCAANTTVELVAEPDAHHHFVSWTGDIDTIGNATAAATNITMYDSYSIVANFELDEGWHSLTILSNYGGSVLEPGEGYFAYAADTTVEVVAEPDDYDQFDYRFREWTGDVDTVANVNAAATNITMDRSYSITPNFEWFDVIQVAAGLLHTVGLKNDGTVISVGYCGYDLCNVGNWTDIILVSAGYFHTMGLKADGTVLAVGLNDSGQCDVDSWMDISQIAAGLGHTVGLKSDSTAVAVGSNEFGQCNVGSWTDIIQISAGLEHTVGLKSDGTVVAVGQNEDGVCNVEGWADIIQVSAGLEHTVGLKSDGTVVAVGLCGDLQCNVGSWTDITQIVAGERYTVGLKVDGTVVAVGSCHGDECLNVSSWTDIIQVAAGQRHTVGLENDGTVVAVGWGGYGECNV